MKAIRFVTLFTIFYWALSLQAYAGEPTRQLSATLTEFVSILTKTPVSELRATGLPARAKQLVFARFDFNEMTKLALGEHWGRLADGERKDFIAAFTHKLLVGYGRTVRAHGDEQVEFKDEQIEGGAARVQTFIVREGRPVMSIDYQLHRIGAEWKVCDVTVDSVSLVRNFHAQFRRVIAKSSIQDLLRQLRE